MCRRTEEEVVIKNMYHTLVSSTDPHSEPQIIVEKDIIPIMTCLKVMC